MPLRQESPIIHLDYRSRRLIAILFLSLTSFSSAQTLTTMIRTGPSSNRVDIVFVGDGYQSHEIETTYVTHVQRQLNHMFGGIQDPFPRYDGFFNVHRVNVISPESGADKPPLGIFVNTALDASYWWDGATERLLYLSNTKANAAVSTALSGTGIDVDMRYATVNDTKYGGGGGTWGVYAGGNAAANEVALHEIGHSFGGLADEYFFANTTYAGGEPIEPNVTISSGTQKWDRWLGYVDPTNNIGPIGYYQGGRYNAFGIYRPSINSKMRSLDRPFDAISRERFIQRIYNEVNPLDDWLSNSTPLTDPPTLWVDPIDENVIGVEWYLDDRRIAVGSSLDLGDHFFSEVPGVYSLRARAYDTILDHQFSGDALDWWRLDNASLEQWITWTIEVSGVSGDFNADGTFDCHDIDPLVAEIVAGTHGVAFDLTADGQVDSADLDSWLAQAGFAQSPVGLPYLRGDANLDGVVDIVDFNVWNNNKFTATGWWCGGDFNADGAVDASDFNLWNSHKFTSNLGFTAVPEPSLMGICWLAFASWAVSFRRNRQSPACEYVDRQIVLDGWQDRIPVSTIRPSSSSSLT